MSVFEFHQEMTLNQCFVQVGQDRIEKILTSSQFQVLSNRLTINIKSISTAQINSQDTEDRVAGIENQDFLDYRSDNSDTSIDQIDNSQLVRIFSCFFPKKIHYSNILKRGHIVSYWFDFFRNGSEARKDDSFFLC